jgi:uncharacterized membrane protein YhiD involved in acid resistance
MAIGYGFYAIAIIASFVSVFIPRLPHWRHKEIKETTDKIVKKKVIKKPKIAK